MILRSFLFSLQASYRFVISTCYFARLDGLSIGNMIPDLLSSDISNEKSLFVRDCSISLRSTRSLLH